MGPCAAALVVSALFFNLETVSGGMISFLFGVPAVHLTRCAAFRALMATRRGSELVDVLGGSGMGLLLVPSTPSPSPPPIPPRSTAPTVLGLEQRAGPYASHGLR